MSLTTATTTPMTGERRPAAAWKRLCALVTVELKMLLRNGVNVFYAVAMGPMMVLFLSQLPHIKAQAELAPRGGLATMLTALLLINSLGIGIYYNLTTATVARRESLVLKRLRSGEARATEILAAIATPNLILLALQLVLVLGAVSWALGAPRFTNALAILLSLGLGSLFFTLCALLTASGTRTVESAQMTTMPGIMGFLVLSGLLIPLSAMPERVREIFQLLPVAPVSDLLMIGLNGTTLDGRVLDGAASWGAMLSPALVLGCWCLAGIWLLRRMMRWEPIR